MTRNQFLNWKAESYCQMSSLSIGASFGMRYKILDFHLPSFMQFWNYMLILQGEWLRQITSPFVILILCDIIMDICYTAFMYLPCYCPLTQNSLVKWSDASAHMYGSLIPFFLRKWSISFLCAFVLFCQILGKYYFDLKCFLQILKDFLLWVEEDLGPWGPLVL